MIPFMHCAGCACRESRFDKITYTAGKNGAVMLRHMKFDGKKWIKWCVTAISR